VKLRTKDETQNKMGAYDKCGAINVMNMDGGVRSRIQIDVTFCSKKSGHGRHEVFKNGVPASIAPN